MTDLPPHLRPRRLTNDPFNPRGRWVVRCVIPGCRTGFYAEGSDREDVTDKARVHLYAEHREAL